MYRIKGLTKILSGVRGLYFDSDKEAVEFLDKHFIGSHSDHVRLVEKVELHLPKFGVLDPSKLKKGGTRNQKFTGE